MAIPARRRQPSYIDVWIDDPPPTTPFDVVYETDLLRLRRYDAAPSRPELPPVLLVYSLIKRPYILDLLPERSIVRTLLQHGFRIYLTDWLPPGADDSGRGFDAYANRGLAGAVDFVRAREAVDSVSLVGCCCGGLLALVYTALHPQAVAHLVTFAAPFEIKPPLDPTMAGYIVTAHGNVPAWMVGSVLNARMRNPYDLPGIVARDFGEQDLARPGLKESRKVLQALRPWLESDVPLAGRVFLETVQDALPGGRLIESRFEVAGRCVDLKNVTCPVLAIEGERDGLVPAQSTACLVERVGSTHAANILFRTGHLGLMVSLAAQNDLWPQVCEWLERSCSAPLAQSA